MSRAIVSQVEEKFYLRWVNFLLYPNHQITSLADLKDGFLLLKICELVLDIDEEESVIVDPRVQTASSTSSTFSRKRQREWAINNITEVYNYCDRIRADVRSIPGDDILEGKIPSIINFLAALATAIYVIGVKFQGVTGEVALLQWVREIAMGVLPAGMTSFSGCWNDGYALSILSIFPEKEVDESVMSSLKQFTPLERVTVALRTLSDKGAPLVFDPPDIVMGVFTPRCMKVYVGMLFSLSIKVPLNIIQGVKKEEERIEQYQQYRIHREEEKARKEEKSAMKSGGISYSHSTPSSISSPLGPGSSVLTTPH